jgi:hypothetical protein
VIDPFFSTKSKQLPVSASGTSLTVGNWSGSANTVSVAQWVFRGGNSFGFFFFRLQLATTVNSWSTFSITLPSVVRDYFPIGTSGYNFGGGGTYGPSTTSTPADAFISVMGSGNTRLLYVASITANTQPHVRGSIYLPFS